MRTTYEELLDYFTEQELDDATTITKFIQNDYPHLTYPEIYIHILRDMIMQR